MNVNEYALKFTQLSRYAPELVCNIRAQMRKFASGLLNELVLECKWVMLKKDMDIFRLVVYMQQVEEEKKKQAGREERQAKKARSQIKRPVSTRVKNGIKNARRRNLGEIFSH